MVHVTCLLHSMVNHLCAFEQVSVDVPDQKGRLEILRVHARNKKLSDEVDLNQIALRTPGFSGADLANLLNEVLHICLWPPYLLMCWPHMPLCAK